MSSLGYVNIDPNFHFKQYKLSRRTTLAGILMVKKFTPTYFMVLDMQALCGKFIAVITFDSYTALLGKTLSTELYHYLNVFCIRIFHAKTKET